MVNIKLFHLKLLQSLRNKIHKYNHGLQIYKRGHLYTIPTGLIIGKGNVIHEIIN